MSLAFIDIFCMTLWLWLRDCIVSLDRLPGDKVFFCEVSCADWFLSYENLAKLAAFLAYKC